jgi:hypothetical protein
MKGTKRVMRRWGVAALVAATLTPAAVAASPVEQWAKGDRWEVQLEQQPLQASPSPTEWIPSFRLQFAVVERTSKEVRVEVRTVPENRFQERLLLCYAVEGELLTAQVVDPERVAPLGAAGSCGVFGMLGREAFDLAKAPEALARGWAGVASVVKRVALDSEGRLVQTWRPGEAYWRRYETKAGLPQRATLMGGSWKGGTNGTGQPR